jgi:hypothetical protein
VATGSAASPEVRAPTGELVDTPIAASVEGATIEVVGTDQHGTAPLIAKLEKGHGYKVRITARGFAALEIDVKGGDPKQTHKLVAKPRLINVASDPAGAQISVDGTATGKSTPVEIELTPAQAAKKSVHVVLRKQGFRAVDRTVDITKFTEDDTKMTAKLDEKLSPAPAATARPPAGNRPPAGSDAGSDSGSAEPAPGNGSAQPSDGPVTSPSAPPAAPPAPAPTPPADKAPADKPPAAGSAAEPEPDFNKPK